MSSEIEIRPFRVDMPEQAIADLRQRIRVRRPYVDEVDLHPVDLGRELRQRVEFRLACAPVVIGGPVAGQLLNGR